MKRFLLLVTFCTSACAQASAVHSPPTFATPSGAELPYTGPSGVRYGCLARAGDSTLFAIDIIIVRVLDQRGQTVGERVRSARQGTTVQIRWPAIP